MNYCNQMLNARYLYLNYCNQVTAMSRQVKSHVARSVDPSAQGITAATVLTSSVPVLDSPTQRIDEVFQSSETPDCPGKRRLETTNKDASKDKLTEVSLEDMSTTVSVVRHRSKPVAKSIDRTLMIAQQLPSSGSKSTAANGTATKATWTQLQQKQLESALNHVPKGSADRWDRIAELVADKTKVHSILD